MIKLNLYALSDNQIEILNSISKSIGDVNLSVDKEDLLIYYVEEYFSFIECEKLVEWGVSIEEIYFKIKEKLNNEKN